MTLRWESPSSAHAWNAQLLTAPGRPSMFSTYEFAQVKKQSGWTPRYAVVDDIPVTVLSRRAPGFGAVWYVPKGPCVASVEQLAPLLPQLGAAAHRDGAFLLKIEPELLETPHNLQALAELGLIRNGRVQTNASTVLVDVSGTPEDLMARIPSKTRNMFRRATRDDVIVESGEVATEETYERLWRLWMEVVADQGITARDHAYQVGMWRIFCDAGLGRIFLATHQGRDVAGAFVTVVGQSACYKDGASVRDRQVRGASQLLQWETMCWAQEQGATSYDLCGAPHSTKVEDREDPFYGIGTFKRGFNKQVTDWVGALDLPLRPRRYAAWERVGHRVVAKVLARRRGASFY
ncbi:MAG: peptidoglycan bridge formation glycyltransferase FemA/FemB family protein [Ornithinimicrobium sp.]|uniref:lipid II:glycine glycyltransferase FemX n=1 Tax=Ornithinimicrobium sp. TaxID=1977084 RepID=UPI0026DEA768|nr:peptidoglycan bridge formation glycyltransferase FemA/FemB family protein [Ornithinimicrobium sp.]MDO5739208.1 peptidoglycan bridge formation glycyltransferase FemA/FemB family protein [Ornithinimicrobium sp.]